MATVFENEWEALEGDPHFELMKEVLRACRAVCNGREVFLGNQLSLFPEGYRYLIVEMRRERWRWVIFWTRRRILVTLYPYLNSCYVHDGALYATVKEILERAEGFKKPFHLERR